MSQESPPPDHVMDVSDDVIEALNNMTVSGQTEVCSETSSQSGSSSARDAEINNLWVQDDRPDNLQQVENDETDKEKKKKMFKNPIKLLKKLSQVELAPPLHVPEPDLDAVTIDSLPQHFVTKYLGKRRCNGLQGVEHIRGPIDRMVREVTGNAAAEELPLVQVTVWPKGLQANLHPKTKSRDFEPFYLPIDFISFCAEHGSYQKIVGIINVTQMGPKITKTECQAFICHSALEARKLTVSMATAFKLYAERINGSQVKFQVDLRGKDQKGRRHSRNREFEA